VRIGRLGSGRAGGTFRSSCIDEVAQHRVDKLFRLVVLQAGIKEWVLIFFARWFGIEKARVSS